MKSEIRKSRQENWEKIVTILPELEKRYKVILFSHHLRVKVSGRCYYDYYPKGERIGKWKDGRWSPYRDLSVNDFMKLFIG